MTLTYADLLAQRRELDAKIEAVRKEEQAGAIAKIREIVAAYELTVGDIFPSGRGAKVRAPGATSTVAPKYRDPATGQTWTGRGKPPKWIADKNRDEYLIPAA